LKEKKIAGAAPMFSQKIPAKDLPLFELENVILTPHIAGYSQDAINAMGGWSQKALLQP
jgi:D-3-phosphoglycerate dehydrogenase